MSRDIDVFEYLIRHSGLYPSRFVKTFGEESPHWYVESWYKRELSLRHDMVCSLLANMEPAKMKRRHDENGESDGKRAKKNGREDQSATTTSSSSGSATVEPMERENAASSEEEEEDDPLGNEERKFRMILLEGSPSISLIQNRLSEEWGLGTYPDSYWDLADRNQKKFIEVKVSHNPERCQEEFNVKSLMLPHNSALVVFNPTNLEAMWSKHSGDIPGMAKATTFLASRRHHLSTLNALESHMLEKSNLEEEIFRCEWFNKHSEEWASEIWRLRNLDPPENYDVQEGLDVTKVKISEILQYVEDPRKREGEGVKWNGKIAPETCCVNIATEESDDSKIVDEFFAEMGPEIDYGDDPLILAINEARDKWNRTPVDERSSFALIKENEYNDPRVANLVNQLGVGMKRRNFNLGDETTVQEDYRPPEKQRYEPWFDEVVEGLNEQHELPTIPFAQVTFPESESEHPMARAAQLSINKVMSQFVRTKAAVYSSKLTNFYSRLGRSYAPPQYGKTMFELELN